MGSFHFLIWMMDVKGSSLILSNYFGLHVVNQRKKQILSRKFHG